MFVYYRIGELTFLRFMLFAYEKNANGNASTRVNSITYAARAYYLSGFTLHYDYDQRGNIIATSSNSADFPAVSYTYDIQGQLTKEVLDGVTYNYTYDTYGNIHSVTGGESHTYTYGNNEWRDLLTTYDGEPISYDDVGNPTSYFNGSIWGFTWAKGRQLATATLGSSTYTYTYDLNGIRNSKTVNGVTYNYLTQHGKVVRQTWGSNTMDFVYDNSGNPYAMVYNGSIYYYILNQQGDVIRIVDTNGGTQASYIYNAWGKLMDCSGWLATTNPIRYRGYYYDNETGFYYLQSRYYDPSIGRFINADDTTNLAANGGFSSLNLFAYCCNRPIIGVDTKGNWLHIAIGAVVGGALSFAASVAGDISSGESVDWGGAFISAAFGAAGGALSATGFGPAVQMLGGAVLSGAENIVSQGREKGFDNIDYAEVAINTAIGGITSYSNGVGKSNAKYLHSQAKIAKTRIGRDIKSFGASMKYYYAHTSKIFYKPLGKSAINSLKKTACKSIINSFVIKAT